MNENFSETPFSSPICKWALPLVARKDNVWYPSGSSIIIAERLAVTAKHVIEDFMKRFGTEEIAPNRYKHKFFLQAAQILENGETGVLWNVTKIWRSAHTDVAFLLLEPTCPDCLDVQWYRIMIDLRPLEAGAEISAFGYPKPRISTNHTGDTRVTTWILTPSTSTGTVTEIYHEERDSAFLSFPCYQTNARFKPSMSGGPVFTNKGYLCGLVCASMIGEPISYVSALWPSMATPISINRKGFPKGMSYPILELAKGGFISAIGWENIEIKKNDVTGRMRVSYRI